jgi:hypothetical protein
MPRAFYYTGLRSSFRLPCVIIHSLLFSLAISSLSSSVCAFEVSLRTSKALSSTIWNGKSWPSALLPFGYCGFLLCESSYEFVLFVGTKMNGNNFVNSGLQPGREPQTIPMDVSMLMITNRTVLCPVNHRVSVNCDMGCVRTHTRSPRKRRRWRCTTRETRPQCRL